MIHPDTEVKYVNDVIGYGVFATAFIPEGTILYVKDPLEIEVTKSRFKKLDRKHQEIVEKYSYIDERGVRILSWDHAKYMNHSCDCNSISTGYGFEIAITDIHKGEEITDEYGLFNIPEPVDINCQCTNCRKQLLPDDIDQYHDIWDSRVRHALEHINLVSQPLWDVLEESTRSQVMNYVSGGAEYRSVRYLKYVTSSTVLGRKRLKTRAA